jgi:hypothetical protein
MLCRHNRYVQDFGKIKDLDEISRRERIWWEFASRAEERYGQPVGAMSATDFRTALEQSLDTDRFEPLPTSRTEERS